MTEQTQLPLSDATPSLSGSGAASPSAVSPPSPSTATVPAAPAATPAPTRPEWLPESFWDAQKNEFKSADLGATLSDYAKMKADADARAAATPKTPDGYKVELPADFKLPDGYVLDEKNPLVGAFREAAMENGLPQDVFAKVLAKGAAAMANHDKAQRDAITAAIAKRDEQLGPKAGERVEALKSFFKTVTPDPKVQAQLAETLWTPEIIKTFETWAAERAAQGAQPFNQSGRDTPQNDGRPANWETMSALDKRTWQLGDQRAAGSKR